MIIRCLVLILTGFFSTMLHAEDCEKPLKFEEKGNHDYAWFYLTNTHKHKVINVTVKNSWTYNNQRRSETKVYKLAPGQSENVFNFNRKQKPQSEVAGCYFNPITDAQSESDYLTCVSSGYRDQRCCNDVNPFVKNKYQACSTTNIPDEERTTYYQYCLANKGPRCCDHLTIELAEKLKVCGF
ncbi:hypothetical protein [Neptunicella marina]|uniref:Uncharacterized protein n=1 Tax=Neptunicella marina TaxID=2125989 RepID=A0A8J6IST2_9ALTE|nr:hypothetical protein [Neptunicella marina]MBC3765072.1 hypothetical protein [Neptunicella marina]